MCFEDGCKHGVFCLCEEQCARPALECSDDEGLGAPDQAQQEREAANAQVPDWAESLAAAKGVMTGVLLGACLWVVILGVAAALLGVWR